MLLSKQADILSENIQINLQVNKWLIRSEAVASQYVTSFPYSNVVVVFFFNLFLFILYLAWKFPFRDEKSHTNYYIICAWMYTAQKSTDHDILQHESRIM